MDKRIKLITLSKVIDKLEMLADNLYEGSDLDLYKVVTDVNEELKILKEQIEHSN